jgi:hypothetical protein
MQNEVQGRPTKRPGLNTPAFLRRVISLPAQVLPEPLRRPFLRRQARDVQRLEELLFGGCGDHRHTELFS